MKKISLALIFGIFLIINIALAYELPFIENVKILPENQIVGNDLICYHDYFNEFEEHGSRYNWYRNSESLDVDSQILDKDYINPDDEISCEVVPFNGIAYGEKRKSENIIIKPTVKNPYLYIDNILAWNHQEYFGRREYVYITKSLQEALDECVPDKEGYCDLTFSFSSESEGVLSVDDLEIYYVIS